jgi:hypothetical protein
MVLQGQKRVIRVHVPGIQDLADHPAIEFFEQLRTVEQPVGHQYPPGSAGAVLEVWQDGRAIVS